MQTCRIRDSSTTMATVCSLVYVADLRGAPQRPRSGLSAQCRDPCGKSLHGGASKDGRCALRSSARCSLALALSPRAPSSHESGVEFTLQNVGHALCRGRVDAAVAV